MKIGEGLAKLTNLSVPCSNHDDCIRIRPIGGIGKGPMTLTNLTEPHWAGRTGKRLAAPTNLTQLYLDFARCEKVSSLDEIS